MTCQRLLLDHRQALPLDILHFWKFFCKQVCKQQACRIISSYKFGGYDFIASDSLSDASVSPPLTSSYQKVFLSGF